MKIKKNYLLPSYKIITLVIFLFAATKASSQINFKVSDLKPQYQAREKMASPKLHATLSNFRKMIAEHGYKFHVANTGVSELGLSAITGEEKKVRNRQN